MSREGPGSHVILIVDDDPFSLKLLKKILQNSGYRDVRGVANGEMALRFMQTVIPDLILLDIRMPGISGFDVCERLKGDELTRSIPVIFISGMVEIDDKLEGFQKGGVDYITKPFQAEEVLARVQTHLTIRDIQNKLKQQNAELQKQVEERKRAEEELQNTSNDLRDRVKELHCLYEISRLAERHSRELDKVFQELVELILTALQYPSLTCARLQIENRVYTSQNFKETVWRIANAVSVHDETVGQLELFFKKEHSKVAEPIFLKEENHLLDTVCEYLGRLIEREQAQVQVHNLSQQLINAQEAERKRISRELHDTVAQDLTSLKIFYDTLFDDQPTLPETVQKKMANLSAVLKRSIASVRNLAYDLRPPELDDVGLIETLDSLCQDFSSSSGVPIEFETTGMAAVNLDFHQQINLYRLVQEALNNIRKHASAGKVVIKMVAAYPYIIMRIEDDGNGFFLHTKLGAHKNEKHMGLRSMMERAKLLKGKMNIQSSPGDGTRIMIKIPFEEEFDGAH